MVENQIREIRNRLRLAMNGVISTSMREKGIVYKLNFGVPYPEIKEIAASFVPDAALAAALWKENIREFKILATMLQPVELFTKEQAKEWVKEIPYQEIAESCSRNLFSKMPEADVLAMELVFKSEQPFARTVAFLVWMHWLAGGKTLSVPRQAEFIFETTRSLKTTGASWGEKQAAVKALKAYGRQAMGQAEAVLNRLKDFPVSGTSEQQEFYNDLKFDFEYYR